MEGGQKIDINLESPLDTKSSDMLVNVNDVKFAHNRQKYQGHVLPTSLRYERNGWAAGWYVYDFKMGGGYVFSRNDTPVNSKAQWLAVTRSKLNNTPTYVLTFKVANQQTFTDEAGNVLENNRTNIMKDADAVASAAQFQAWYTVVPSLNARECEEALIDSGIQPVLSFNYAVEGNDFKRKLRFNFDVRQPDAATFEQLDDEYGDADLVLEYEDRAPDGTVTATLYNNEVKWVWDEVIYIPKDIVDADGYKYAKFVNVADQTITWKIGVEELVYDDTQGVFVYNSEQFNPGATIGVAYEIPFSYTVALHKYYSRLNNITWAVQGTRILFNNESDSEPTNKYRLSTDQISEANINVYDGTLTASGFDGPDVEVVSIAKFDLSEISNSVDKEINYNAMNYTDISVADMHADEGVLVPILNGVWRNFKLPDSSVTRNVQLQLWCRFKGEGIEKNHVKAYPIRYPFANMDISEQLKEPVYSGTETDNIVYSIDGKQYSSANAEVIDDLDNVVHSHTPGIFSRDICGRYIEFSADVKGINGSLYSDDNHLAIEALNGINTSLAFALSDASTQMDWQKEQLSEPPVLTRPDIDIPLKGTGDYTFEFLNDTMRFSVSSGTYNPALSSHSDLIREVSEGAAVTGAITTGLAILMPGLVIPQNVVFVMRNYNEYNCNFTYRLYSRDASTSDITTHSFSIIQRLSIDNKPYLILKTGTKYLLAEYSAQNISFSSRYVGTRSEGSVNSQPLVEYRISAQIDTYNIEFKVEQCIEIPFGEVQSLRAMPEFEINRGVILSNNKYYVYDSIDSSDIYYTSTGIIGVTEIMDIAGRTVTDNIAANIPMLPSRNEFTLNNATIIGSDVRNAEYSLYVKIGNNYYRYFYNIYYVVSAGRYWITNVPGTSFELTEQDFEGEIYIDLVDIDTGEVILDHNVDYLMFENATLSVKLDAKYFCVGKLFFANNISANLAKQALLDSTVADKLSENLDVVHRESNVGNAFFPIVKDGVKSIYDTDNGSAGYQGIAVFNISNISEFKNYKYHAAILSPLSRYILSPRIVDDDLYVYAGKAYTHHVSINTVEQVQDWELLDDNSNDTQNIVITPREITTYANSIEYANKYYIDKAMLAPAAVTYYNNEMHITYKPASGNSITIAGSTYDLGASDMSVEQTAALVAVYLPAYAEDTKYVFAAKDHADIINVKATKDILNSIADINKYFTMITVDSVSFEAEDPEVTLKAIEYYENRSPVEKSIVYSSRTINEVSEFSDENQLVLESSISGNAAITLPDMPEDNTFIYSVAGNKVSIAVENNSFDYDYAKNAVSNMVIKGKEITKASIELRDADNSSQAYNTYHIAVDQGINTTIYFKHFGIYKIVGTTVGSRTPGLNAALDYDPNTHIFTFNVKDMNVVSGMGTEEAHGTYAFDFDDFDDKEQCTPKFLVYSATDVRDPNPLTQTKEFARVMADNEYQLIKQHWDSTVATENFWWLDPTHTLKLTKDRFVVESKVIADGYHDWNGDKWAQENEFNRTKYLTSECDTFIVSSANGKTARGYLYILQPVTETSISVTVYDPLTVVDNEMQVVRKCTIEFKHVALSNSKSHTKLNAGNVLTHDSITVCTYSDIVSSSLLADCKLTAVNINGVHWLGIQYDKNFNQWSFGLGEVTEVVQGYGVIGVNGYATGGMLPAKYFDGHGFTDEVYDISELEAEEGKTLKSLDEFNIFKERVVGDENQQWYIAKELNDIVMSVDLAKNNVVTLPITNKYAQVYSSPSYAKYTVHALGIQIKQLMDMIIGGADNPIWVEIIKYAMFPIVWYLSPYTNVINYLQQTLGQYAYTHYNSTSISRKSSKLHDEVDTDNAGLSENEDQSHIDALISDDLSFDVQHIAQEQSFKDKSWNNILGIFASMVVSATEMSMRDVVVNTYQNQSAVSDIGKKFGQAFLQNIGSMSVTGFTMQSTKPMLKSEVTAVKTLDMFYSTSAEQKCYAGPGFVNMQFVAQCTAQSVTSVQLEVQQTQMLLLLKELTTWQGKTIIFLLDGLKELMFKMADVMGGGPSAGMVVGLGWIGALITAGVGYAIVAAKGLVKLGIEMVDSMLDSFFPGGVKTTVTAQLSRHNYDIEGKHAYGNKSEQFFWPCADCKSKLYTDESVEAILQDKPWPLEMPTATTGNQQSVIIHQDQPECITITPDIMTSDSWNSDVPYSIAMCKGKQTHRALPDSTAYVIGTESFMPTAPFKNENIGEGEPVFTPAAIQDYLVDKNWNIFVTAMEGDALWVSCKDTKLFDGNYSNIVVTDDFCGIAAPHVAVEVKRNICEEYLRPWAVSPDAIALNITGLNCAYDEVAYHAFDGYGYRITDWLGSSGMNKERYTMQYCFQINDRFKRSNKLPPNQFMGNFQALPSMSLDINDKIFNEATIMSAEKGLRAGVTGENKDQYRYALPIFTEQISSLPAIVRALSPYKLAVIDGITSLTTEARVSQSVYKIPDSVDFNINDKLYRMTNEYICSVKHSKGVELVEYLVPALGLKYLGATPFMAYFYNQATRQYYIYQGGNTLQVMDMLERFRDIKDSTYDFVNQEVVMPCLATFDRLDKNVKDDADETDNIVIPVFRHNKVGGELTPPIDTIFNTRSWYRTLSTPAGLVFQGPNRCIINRFVWSQYMLEDIKANKGKWKKVPREEYHPFRTYAEKYQDVLLRLDSKLKGWTHNPFLLVTAPLGINEQTDCKFEWEVTFAWTTEMEQLFEQDEYVTVNVMAETMCPGGKVFSRPTHIFLTKDLFTRTENVGYYSFRYQSNNGAGNRERLHIWSDGYIAISGIQLEYKIISEKRTEKLVIQEDIKGMREM